MEDIFIKILNMSITASYFALAVILLRLIFRKMPKWISCILWGLVGLRLLLPFSFESILSLVPSSETVPQDIILTDTPSISSGIPILNYSVNPIINEAFAPKPYESANPMQIIMLILSVLWISGTFGLLLYALISYLHIKRKTAASIKTEKGIFICDTIDTPFILGVLRPKIYIPSSINDTDKNFIIAHEKAHIKRKDYLWKPLGFLILSIHWFNPLMWAAFILLCRDIESACDEKVIKELNADGKKSYSMALINCSSPKKFITACPLAFGETGVKQRIKNVLNYKKPALTVVIITVILSILLSVLFLTNPETAKINSIENYENIFRSVEKLQFFISGNYIYTTEDPADELRILKRIKINPEPVSENRSTDRDTTYKIEVNDKITIHIDGSFSQLWLDDNYTIKLNINSSGSSVANTNEEIPPSFSYKIENPDILKKLFDKISTPLNPTIETKTSPLYTEFDGVYIKVKSIDKNNGGHFVFNIIWTNETDSEITYGEFYDIEIKNGDNWESVAVEDIAFPTIGYTLNAKSTVHEKYSTQRFDISKIGNYRLITDFSCNDGNIYKTYVEFQINNAHGDISDIGGVSGPQAVLTTKKMTLEDVIRLSKKGDKLSWKDFEDYSYIVTGMGIYIRMYEIDDMFSLYIGSFSPESEPIYMRLEASDGTEDVFDMTKGGDIKSFINRHKDNPVIKNVSYGFKIAPVEYNEKIFGKMISIGGIPPKIAYSSIRALPTVRITSIEELNNFIEEMKEVSDFTETSPAFIGFANEYTEEDFESNNLLIVYTTADSSDTDFRIEYATVSPAAKTLGMGIQEVKSYVEDKKNTGYFILVAMMNEQIEDAEIIDARLSSSVYPQQVITDSQIIRTYIFENSRESIYKPNFTLYKNGKFMFNFSPFSSYFGTGKYEKQGNTLILRTNDGKYTYTFEEVNDTMIFDAENSSDNLHLSDITDKSIFY